MIDRNSLKDPDDYGVYGRRGWLGPRSAGPALFAAAL
jgi:hypothetical protein